MLKDYMTFLQGLNNYFYILVILLATVLVIGFGVGAKRGGLIRHLPYFLSLFVLSVYGLITPFFFYTSGFSYIIGTDISNYYGAGLAFNLIAVLSFIIGYWLLAERKDQWESKELGNYHRPEHYITILFVLFFSISMINLALGGINLAQVLVGDAVVGLGARGATYFLQNFTDSLISVIILAYIFDMPKKKLALIIFLSFFLFTLLGFRYRIILSMIGMLFVYLYKNKVSLKLFVSSLALGLIFFYAIMFSTVNRHKLVNKQYGELVTNPIEFDYSIFFDQTRGGLADMAIYRHYDIPGRGAQHDHGVTMFGYVFIRMIPRAIMPDKDKFYPPPQLATTIAAYDAWWGKFSGEATLNIAAFYIAFGWLGVVLGSFFWGLFLKRYGNSIRKGDPLKIASYIIVSLVTFQWITRGYMPQIIDNLAYMIVPVLMLKFFSKRKISR